MIKIINSVPYSTDSSCRLGYFQHRTILDPAYHREELYITRQGTYFHSPYCFQGDPFPAAGCDNTVLSDIEARIWAEHRLTPDECEFIFPGPKAS